MRAQTTATVEKTHGLTSKPHPFIPNASEKIRQKMLATIGVRSVDELYSDIPNHLRVKGQLKIPGFSSEQEVLSHIDRLLARNQSAVDLASFLGAGIYNHYLPAAVRAILSRVEFQTAYTPYQAEASQGLLQALFEFQSMLADLTGMDAVNSSMYDMATGLGESARMASRTTGRKRILVPRSLHPDRLSVARNYAEPEGIEIQTVEYNRDNGGLDTDDLQSKLSSDVAAVYCEVPNFFGVIDPAASDVPSIAHEKGALAIIGFDPVSLGGLKGPGEYGADIAIAEGQSISVDMNYGGPLLGIMGCRGSSLIRQMPGRIIGMTTTLDGQDTAYSMVLQTREQHIRRERATSNICTNEALLAIGAGAYLALLGPNGLRHLFETIMARTSYTLKRLSEIDGLTVPCFDATHYQDLTLSYPRELKAAEINRSLLAHGIHGGRVLSSEYPELGESSLISVTEQTTPEAIDKLAETMAECVQK